MLVGNKQYNNGAIYIREREREREISMCSKKKVKDDVKGVKGEKSTQEYRF